MERVLKSYGDNNVYYYFEKISSIPRGSGNEKAIADYLVSFADENGLYVYRDDVNNVLIKKPASKGRENEKPVMLQGHTDMVCEKDGTSDHDFITQGIKLVLDGKWLHAEGTTLGGDDGAAVAAMLAILYDKTLSHPPVECLFTVGEETSMVGANKFDYSNISSKRILNLDSEDLDTVTVGCAGGCSIDVVYTPEKYKLSGKPITVSVSGLAGGHSGSSIHLGRVNANNCMARLLTMLYEEEPFNLISINGGTKHNAITRECKAVISVYDKKAAKEKINEFSAIIKNELTSADKKFNVRVSGVTEKPEFMFCFKDTSRILSSLVLLPSGEISKSFKIPGLTETSSNIGIVKQEDNKITLNMLARSLSESKMDEIVEKIKLVAKYTGGEFTELDRYPGWDISTESPIRDTYIEAYKELLGKKPKVEAIHAGLECGIIGAALGGVDAISIGPDVLDIHTPREKLDLETFGMFYKLVVETLKRI